MPKRLTYEEVKKIIESDNDYKLLSDSYINNRQKLKIKHLTCGNIFERTLYEYQANKKCHKCAVQHRTMIKTKTKENFQKDMDNIFNGDMIVIGDYINNKTKIMMYNKRCKHYFEGYPVNLLKGNGCNICCNRSKGNEKVKEILNNLKINYQSEYGFEDCKYKRTLKFDFYLKDFNTCIEYDGVQHYSDNTFRYGEKFKDQRIRDSIKDDYCKNNNIKLIRIPYTEFNNIETILKEELNL